MTLYVLFAQRRESYSGEYAPEALAVADEYAMDDNPEWMDSQIKEQVLAYGDEFVGYKVLRIALGEGSQALIRRLVLDQHAPIRGEISA